MGVANSSSVDSATGRDTILGSALRQFNERGYHGTSMRDIAGGADMTAASIYHHFKSKQEILQALMNRALQGALGMTRTGLVRAGEAPADQLRALVRTWVGFHTTHQLDAVVGATELRSVEEPGRGLVVALRDQQEALFREVIARGVEEGVFHTRYPRDATRAIISMGQSICTWYRQDGPMSADELAGRYEVLALATVQYENP